MATRNIDTEMGLQVRRLIDEQQRPLASIPSLTSSFPSLSSAEISGRMIRSGLPSRHREARPDGLDRTGPWAVAYTGALEVVNNGGMVCVLGQRGTGKTQLATELARTFIINRNCERRDQDTPVLYVRAMELFAALRGAFRKGSDQTEIDAMSRFRRVPLLIIDEIQERGETEFEDRMLVLLLDQRYGDMKPTVILSNLARAELAASLGKSVVSRIQEVGTVIECTWPSYRAKAAKAAGGAA